MYWYLCVHFQYVPNECLSNLCRRICCLKCGSPRTYCLSDVMPGCKIHLSSKPSEDRICRWNQPEGIRLLIHILTLDSTCNSSNLRSWDHTLVLLTIYLSWTRSYAGLTDAHGCGSLTRSLWGEIQNGECGRGPCRVVFCVQWFL